MNFDSEPKGESSNVINFSAPNLTKIDPNTIVLDTPKDVEQAGSVLPVSHDILTVRSPITVPDLVSADQSDRAEAAVPRLPLSNEDFVAHVFRDLSGEARPLICSKNGNPEVGGWLPAPADAVDQQCLPHRNNYINCSSFLPGDDGGFHARKEQASAFHFLMLDDVETKVERSRLADCLPLRVDC